jgi:hypothetical protein
MQLEGAGHKAAMTMEEAEHAAKHAQTPEALHALVARLLADKRGGRAVRAGGFGPKECVCISFVTACLPRQEGTQN